MATVLDLLPAEYGFVALAVIASTVTVVLQGGSVMEARKLYKVPYPDMYATVIEVDGKKYTNAKDPESAKLFNCAQRGHQNALESHYYNLVLAVTGGLAAPVAAAGSLIVATIGFREYARQYRCAGPENRNNKLALCKYIGLLGLLGSNFYLAYVLLASKLH
ncbi:Microsomal glutathione S-transferase 3 [Hondaea fermentalgiana]|uniref:Microsomal glutathione S-transferase 3 n=1 Tax=Hondaea fermentalgiana TaxID=2315210 RepID=A0A2R5GAS0_9STRA|nr:Microsomal glutathione S-transferase 3 [Hondaea fermentalgiana]|eukprot:GBG28100.1 Microsomal glutathione S-transferase 3 [Hondaea fermentalgiana]